MPSLGDGVVTVTPVMRARSHAQLAMQKSSTRFDARRLPSAVRARLWPGWEAPLARSEPQPPVSSCVGAS
jgi:hypothetical protein